MQLPEFGTRRKLDPDREILVVTNGDSRESANVECWEVQSKFEEKLFQVLKERFSLTAIRGHAVDEKEGHGFIAGQRQGSDMFMSVEPDSPVIVLLTAWQYSHHLAPSLVHHRGPILVLANFDGTWPGLVGALCMAGTLTSLGRSCSRLWSENFDDPFFFDKLEEWLKTGDIKHDVSYLKEIKPDSDLFGTEAGKLGRYLGEYVLHRKEILGLFDSFCMGMMNGVFPQKTLCDIGMPLESLSQSMLVYEMGKVPRELREQCLQYYIDRGMQFQFGDDPATELTRDQVLEQCAMLIAMARVTENFGLSCVGVQYQQGLKDVCPASDFAEGAIGSTDRFPIPHENGTIIRPGRPIPCANEVDMGTAIPGTMLFRLLQTLGLPSETTLHDVRWGSEYQGTFYWDFLISGSVPFEHLKGGIAGAIGCRQSPMYFAKGGSTIAGQCKRGRFVWARAHYEGLRAHMHIGTGRAFELPQEEFQRRLDATTDVWPLMNVTLDGVGRDDLMAGHQSNHVTVAYVPEEHLKTVVRAFACMALTQNMTVHLAGTAEI
ncbi:MAG: signal transduction protein [Proteobacteria bacterium]|nr:signal transduction protein [Pseudomonadota bacterium]